MQPHREEDEIPVLEPVPTMEAGGPPLHQTVEEVVLEPQVASPVQIQSTAGLTEGTPDMPPSRNTGEVGAHDTPPIVAAGAVHGEAGGEAIQSRSRLDIGDGATSHSGDEPRLHPAHRVDPQALTGAVGPPLSDRDILVPRPLDLLSPSQGAERRSDPEVRVTIGRVIVKSAREDRPSRQESPARPGPALTLDAYLKDRREGKR